MVSLKVQCACGQHYSCEVDPSHDGPVYVNCPSCQRDGSAAVNQFLAQIRHRLIPIKIICPCGQKYAFEVRPREGKMPWAVACPVCRCDGTAEANRIIANLLAADPRTLAPPAVNDALNTLQATLAPHLVNALKDAVVKELATQRRELLSAQQVAVAELTELARRLESVQAPLLERLRAYEGRISELERDLADQSKENRELLKLKINLLRERIESERNESERVSRYQIKLN